MDAQRQGFFVDFEYGDLKAAIVGVPFMIFPDFSVAKWAVECMKVLPEADYEKALALSGLDSYEIGKYEVMERENLELIAILERSGVKVLRPEVLTRERIVANFGEPFLKMAGAIQQYVRDPLLVVGDNVIENAMGSLIRRADILGLRSLLTERLSGSKSCWAAMPGVDYSKALERGAMDKSEFPALEGGDVIVLGEKIFVGTSLNPTTGSSELGFRWLKSFLAPKGYDVEQVRLTEDVMHLDVALSIPRPGLVILCPELFVDGVPAYFDNWKRIEVSKEDARHLAVNGLPLNPRSYVLGSNDLFDWERHKARLEAEGLETHVVPFARHNEDGGSIRCSVQALVRRLQ